ESLQPTGFWKKEKKATS
ncbi:hypothetical protein TbgDal_II490, partial [Trypanosoma brucei gambiense DAL972]